MCFTNFFTYGHNNPLPAYHGSQTEGDGNRWSEFVIGGLPWPPTPFAAGSGDTFYVSTAPPIDIADEGYYGFPYVPQPTAAA